MITIKIIINIQYSYLHRDDRFLGKNLLCSRLKYNCDFVTKKSFKPQGIGGKVLFCIRAGFVYKHRNVRFYIA